MLFLLIFIGTGSCIRQRTNAKPTTGKETKKQSKIITEPYTTLFGSIAEPSKPAPVEKK